MIFFFFRNRAYACISLRGSRNLDYRSIEQDPDGNEDYHQMPITVN